MTNTDNFFIHVNNYEWQGGSTPWRICNYYIKYCHVQKISIGEYDCPRIYDSTYHLHISQKHFDMIIKEYEEYQRNGMIGTLLCSIGYIENKQKNNNTTQSHPSAPLTNNNNGYVKI